MARVNEQRFLVTGAFGCIGAWTVKRLVDAGHPVWTYDLPGNPHRLQLIMDDASLARVHLLQGDITDAAQVERALVDHGITHIIHLAALQVPFVRADPIRGALVNVVGTTIVFEMAKRHRAQIAGLVYASSMGVYGPADRYPDAPLAHDAPLMPPTLYGVNKQANEGTAQVYWDEYQLPSIGIRPYVVYGPGRDQGWTSTPTKAMLAAAADRDYEISYGGTCVFQYADDVAAICVAAVQADYQGADVFNIGGSTASMDDVVAAIDAAAPAMAGRISYVPAPLPHPPTVDATPLDRAIGVQHYTPLSTGVAATVDHFRWAIAHDKIDVARVLG